MNSLQKRAWINLGVMTIAVAVAGTGVGLAVQLNAKGVVPLMTFLVAGLLVGLFSGLRSIANESKLDERERKIAVRAFVFSSYTFVLFTCFASFGVFYIVGAKSSVPTYTLPVLLLGGLFLSQFVESAMILIQFAREQVDE